MISKNKLLEDMRHIVLNRNTYYNNEFPYNCGYIHDNGSLSFDCIGLVKSYINNPDIAYKTTPPNYYVKPGIVIPDLNEIGILYDCSNVKWNDFKLTEGEYLYMDGHGALYVGNLFGKNSNVNVVECTTAWNTNGVVASWIDADGTRRDRKNGNVSGRWEAHGKLNKYVNYDEWYVKGGEWYHAYAKGWLYDYSYGGWFLLDSNGKMLKGWQKVGKYWYYLCTKNDGTYYTGQMVTGSYNVPSKFDSSGHWIA